VRGCAFCDATGDGQKFLMVERDPPELRPVELVVVPDWVEELKARHSRRVIDARVVRRSKDHEGSGRAHQR